jgi:hypothetical protein
MATSGTVGQSTFNVLKIIEMAMRRAGLKSNAIGAETMDIARSNLHLYLSHLSNQGVNLWCLEKSVLGVTPQSYIFTLPVGTIEVLNASYRTMTRLSGGTAASSSGGTAANAFDGDTTTACTQTATGGNISYALGAATQVSTVGYLPNATGSLNLTYQYSTNSGVTWSTAYAVGATSYTAGVWEWFDLPINTEAADWRVSTSAGTLDAREVYFGSSPAETTMARLNRDDYTALPNKTTTGTPLQFWFDRQRASPRMWVWPVPTNTLAQIVVWRHRHVEDIGVYTNEVEIPQRWLEAIVMNLAWKLALETPSADMQRIDYLRKIAEKEEFEASAEERDASPIYFNPAVVAYTT